MPVILHGTESTDMTLLVSSLVAILMNADARTVKGCVRTLLKTIHGYFCSFQALINREWLLSGHPFTTRLSHIAYATGTQTGPYEAPTFLCFLDCVYQVRFTITLIYQEHIYSCNNTTSCRLSMTTGCLCSSTTMHAPPSTAPSLVTVTKSVP